MKKAFQMLGAKNTTVLAVASREEFCLIGLAIKVGEFKDEV